MVAKGDHPMVHGEHDSTSTDERGSPRGAAANGWSSTRSWPVAGSIRSRFGWRSRLGQSMVELALMLPVIILILLGTVDLGRAFFDYVRLTNAVREGALTGIRIPDPTVVQYRVT